MILVLIVNIFFRLKKKKLKFAKLTSEIGHSNQSLSIITAINLVLNHHMAQKLKKK